nr:hypothetical protein [Tanacetum cinerariifolium]
MLVAQEVEQGDADENVENVNVGDAAEGDVSAANDEVPTGDEEPSIPSPTPLTPPPQPSHDIPSTSQGRMITYMDADVDVVLEEAKDGRPTESQAKIYKFDLDHANKVLSMQEEESELVELQEVVEIVTTTKIITEVVTAASITISAAEVPVPAATTVAAPTLTVAPRIRTKGVVIRDPEKSTTTTSTIIHSEAKSKDKDWDEVIDHVNKKAKEDKSIKRYKAMKRKPQTEAQARKNMMVYIKNVAGFKMDYFKEQIDEEESRALKRINETPAEKAAKRRKLNEKVKELKRHL